MFGKIHVHVSPSSGFRGLSKLTYIVLTSCLTFVYHALLTTNATQLSPAVAYLPLGHLGHAPLWTAKNLAYGKKCNQNAPFSGKISKIFWGGGTVPSKTLPPLGREIPLTRPLTSRRSPRPPPNFFPNFYHYARRWCCYWRIWEIESSFSFVSRPRHVKWNAFRSGTS